MQRSDPRQPVRIVHLGLGAFFRAHQAWYTEEANSASPEGEGWGIHAFTGRSPRMADALTAQDCLYTLIVRAADGDTVSVVSSVSRASDGADAETWRVALANPDTAVLTLTITEAGYLQDSTAPARIVDGLRARWQSCDAPLAIVSCDNLPHNGRVARDAVLRVAETVDAELAEWIRSHVSFVSTMVDRITPASTEEDVATARELTGTDDAVPVVTEPFSEWVLSGEFPLGRPKWETAGARVVENIEPYEQRKLWLLNAGHSLLAYVGLLRGASTIDQAMTDADSLELLEELWREAAVVLPFPASEIDAALAALRERFTNPRIQHLLRQIAAGGSQKLPPRILDVHRARRAAGLPAGPAGAAVLAAWALHLRGDPDLVSDPSAASLMSELRREASDDTAGLASRTVLFLAPDLASDAELIAAVGSALTDLKPELGSGTRR